MLIFQQFFNDFLGSGEAAPAADLITASRSLQEGCAGREWLELVVRNLATGMVKLAEIELFKPFWTGKFRLRCLKIDPMIKLAASTASLMTKM